jgi:hypothetical protein
MNTKYYLDAAGVPIGGFNAGNPAIPEGATEVEYRIYDLLIPGLDRHRLPTDIDFKTALTGNLFKEVTMLHGAPVHKIYYMAAEAAQNGAIIYSVPAVRIDYFFERDSISLAKSCTQEFRWYDTFGNLSAEFKTVKDYFNAEESLTEATQRRNNIVSDLKVKIIGLIMYTTQVTQAAAADTGKAFLTTYKIELINFIDEANPAFLGAVTNASAETYPWLDNMTPYGVTIRQVIINGLS